MTDPCCGLSVIVCSFILHLIGRETINIPEIFSSIHGFTGKTVKCYCEQIFCPWNFRSITDIRIPRKINNAVCPMQTSALVLEIFKFEKYPNDKTDDVIHSTQYYMNYSNRAISGTLQLQQRLTIETWQANRSIGNTPNLAIKVHKLYFTYILTFLIQIDCDIFFHHVWSKFGWVYDVIAWLICIFVKLYNISGMKRDIKQ